MAIQMRRGNYSDFNPNQMQPGEWAVSISDGNKRVFMCFARPGDVIEIPTIENIVDLQEIEQLKEEIEGYVDDAEGYADSAAASAEASEQSTITSITATVDANVGTPSVEVQKTSEAPNKSFRFDFHNIKGVQGVQGETGVGISSVALDNTDHLKITYDDSTAQNPHIDDAGEVTNGNKIYEVTQAQYNALPTSDKMDPTKFWWITDAL